MGSENRRFKKLIAVAYATADKVPSMFPRNCYVCNKKSKLGCKKPFKTKVIWVANICPLCEGENSKCVMCKGFGTVNMYQCPFAQVREVSYILSYYTMYKSFGHFPAQGGQLNQTVDTLSAFLVLDQSIRLVGPKEVDKEVKK